MKKDSYKNTNIKEYKNNSIKKIITIVLWIVILSYAFTGLGNYLFKENNYGNSSPERDILLTELNNSKKEISLWINKLNLDNLNKEKEIANKLTKKTAKLSKKIKKLNKEGNSIITEKMTKNIIEIDRLILNLSKATKKEDFILFIEQLKEKLNFKI